MTDTFNSCAEAVAYAMSHRKGPQAARSSVGRGPKGYRSHWDASAVRACMSRAGIEIDSPEERALADWALRGGEKPVKVERVLRRELDRHGMLRRENEVERPDVARYVWVDIETGVEMTTLAEKREGEDEGEDE